MKITIIIALVSIIFILIGYVIKIENRYEYQAAENRKAIDSLTSLSLTKQWREIQKNGGVLSIPPGHFSIVEDSVLYTNQPQRGTSAK